MAKYKVTVGKKVLTHEADKYTVDAGILILWNSKEGNHARPHHTHQECGQIS
jgi:hypothetical protein